MAEYTKEPFISELHLKNKKKKKTKLEREFVLNWVTINKKKLELKKSQSYTKKNKEELAKHRT